jgi:hypothetical protein
MRRILLALAMTLALGACSADETPPAEPKSDGDVPTETVPVYLATALACRYLDREDVSFAPLVVEGPGYSTTVEPSEDCAEQSMFNTYVFDVPMPASGDGYSGRGSRRAPPRSATRKESVRSAAHGRQSLASH